MQLSEMALASWAQHVARLALLQEHGTDLVCKKVLEERKKTNG